MAENIDTVGAGGGEHHPNKKFKAMVTFEVTTSENVNMAYLKSAVNELVSLIDRRLVLNSDVIAVIENGSLVSISSGDEYDIEYIKSRIVMECGSKVKGLLQQAMVTEYPTQIIDAMKSVVYCSNDALKFLDDMQRE